MREIADGLFLLTGFPPAGFNVYLVRSGDEAILVDTSTRHARRRILRQLPERIDSILITHAHRDHAGAMHDVATSTGAPIWASDADSDALEGKAPEPMPEQHKDNLVNRMFAGWWRDRHYTGLPQLGEMPEIFTVDVPESRRSIRKLAAINPSTVCFGHGRPLTRNATTRIGEFAAGLK